RAPLVGKQIGQFSIAQENRVAELDRGLVGCNPLVTGNELTSLRVCDVPFGVVSKSAVEQRDRRVGMAKSIVCDTAGGLRTGGLIAADRAVGDREGSPVGNASRGIRKTGCIAGNGSTIDRHGPVVLDAAASFCGTVAGDRAAGKRQY